jgi:hypothetical protein
VSAEILTDAALWIAEFDLRGSMNAIGLQAEVETRDCTCFGEGARTYALGQQRVSFSAEGFPIDDATDAALFDLMGQGALPMTIGKARSEGAVAFVGSILDAGYSSLMSVSEVRRFSTTGELSSRSFGRGRIMTIAAAATATANGTGRLLRAISATKKAFATLHVTAVDGTTPTMDVIIQSDDNSGFTSATTRGTFTQITEAGSQLIAIDGAVADTYWRAQYTIGGTDPEFTFAVALGFEEPV